MTEKCKTESARLENAGPGLQITSFHVYARVTYTSSKPYLPTQSQIIIVQIILLGDINTCVCVCVNNLSIVVS